MTRHNSRVGHIRRLAALLVPTAAAVLIGFQVKTSAQPAAGGAAPEPPGVLPGSTTESLIKKAQASGLKFHGATDCSNEKCHGRAEPLPAPKQPGNEYNLWSGEDPHNKAAESLGKGDSEKAKKGMAIWAKYKPLAKATEASPAESARCTTCHSLTIPAALKGPAFNPDEGVSCSNCHGPYSKAKDPHKVEGWAKAERAKFGNDPVKFFDTWGIVDTKVVQARADKCTSCHLAIDADMVKADHPQPRFELYFYSLTYPGRHWRQEEGYFGVKLWAVGQVVSLRDAMFQLAQRASNAATPDDQLTSAYNQAMAHYTAFSPLLKTKAVTAADADVKGLDGWAANLKGVMASKDKTAIAKAATNIVSYAVRLTKAVTEIKADKAAVVQMLTADTTAAAGFGDLGLDQQRNAIYALYNSLATSPDKPAEAESKAVLDLISTGLYPPEGKDTVDPAVFAKTLAAIKAKLPK